MNITSYGAAGTVTGSCHLLDIAGTRLLVDCGMFQGEEHITAINYEPLGFEPSTLDAVLLTHGHLDHCGRLPLLTRRGFHGPIYATRPTYDIARLILTDSARIQYENCLTQPTNRPRQEGTAYVPLVFHPLSLDCHRPAFSR